MICSFFGQSHLETKRIQAGELFSVAGGFLGDADSCEVGLTELPELLPQSWPGVGGHVIR